MVLVYRDLATAHTERQNAQTAAGEDATLNGDLGPQLVPGYGPASGMAAVSPNTEKRPVIDRVKAS